MAGKSKTVGAAGKPDFELSGEEIEVLVRVIRKHRNTLPSYLLSKRRELEILDMLLEKLS